MTNPLTMHLLIDTPQTFQFDQILSYLSRSANECLFQTANGVVTRCIPVENEKPVVTIGAEPDGRLLLRITGAKPSSIPTVAESIKKYVSEWFDLERDLMPFYEMARQDPLLRDPAERFSGLRLVGVPDLFEALGWAILGQQINLPFAYTLKRRLVEAFGGSALDGHGNRHFTFPSPETVAHLQISDLAGLHMTVKKAEYLIGAATRIAEGSLTKQMLLETGDLHAAERMLTNMRGIGPWTAHYVAMRCLRFPDAFPIQDVGLHLAMQKQLGMDRKPDLAEIRFCSAGWTGWEAYATFYLWRTLY